ncbi:multisubunit Na+/H+ antiporter, MnhF subunit [Aciduliprofundum sp. MAR08-339]|uniref:cation:proton antiporter n=1 Tax=Aciduliprofundum sp. (strain MAR08-339) TaxID=673860 RepID=UPI0002A48A98|nr:multisubunit Na+/H+ antiporter, MnhF subunit [Aciduliprofundum sp. MAR08-339]
MIDIWFLTGFVIIVWILLSLLRVIFGPTAADRVVALDTINTLIVAVMVVLSVAYRELIYVDIAIVYALLSFVSTLYIAKYLEGGI